MKKGILISITLFTGMIFFSSCKKKGCTDPAACNYNSEASKDDGSCQGATTWYQDSDGDGLGNPGSTTTSCTQPIGYVDNSDDQMDAVVEKKSMALVTKMTGTNCGPCGSWGWELFNDIITEVEGEALIMSVYSYSGTEMSTSTGDQWKYDFGMQGAPSFCVNGKNRTEYPAPGSINPAQTQTNVIDASDSTAAVNVLVSMTYQKNIEGTTLTLNTVTKFYANLSGDYYLGAYVIEDGVIADQSGDAGAGASHHYVLRGSVDGTPYGSSLNSASVVANEIIEKTFTMELDASWVTDNITIGLVLWNNVSGSYNFVNAYTESGSH